MLETETTEASFKTTHSLGAPAHYAMSNMTDIHPAGSESVPDPVLSPSCPLLFPDQAAI